MQSVRADAPGVRVISNSSRVNGLQSIEEVRNIVFEASYLVLGLGDVYLGAPVAVPDDPVIAWLRPIQSARTWTPEKRPGLAGLFVHLRNGRPRGYQFVGRTVQV